MKRLYLGLVAAFICLIGTAHADFPDRSITLIVPFSPGGPTDVVARSVGEALGRELGTTVVIDNRTGAGGTIATSLAAEAKPDGYTIFFATTGTMTINPALYKSIMKHDPLKSFVPVGTVASAANVLIVSKDSPYNTVQELISAAKDSQNNLTFASSGNGGITHLTGELFKSTAGLQITHIPYKGSSAAIPDLISQRITMMFDVISGSAPLILDGRLKALAVTSPSRMRIIPDVPTMSEAGVPDFETDTWFGLVAPTGTPEPNLAKLHTALVNVISDPEFSQKLQSMGATPMITSRDDFSRLLQEDTSRWARLVEEFGVSLN